MLESLVDNMQNWGVLLRTSPRTLSSEGLSQSIRGSQPSAPWGNILGCIATCTIPQLQPPLTCLHQLLEPWNTWVLHLPSRASEHWEGLQDCPFCSLSPTILQTSVGYSHGPPTSEILQVRSRPHLHVHTNSELQNILVKPTQEYFPYLFHLFGAIRQNLAQNGM